MWLRVILGSALLVGLIVPSALAGVIGEMGVNIGGIFPQGDYARYADPGLSFLLRVNPHISKAQTISGWFSLGANIFSSDETAILIEADDMVVPGKKNVDEYGFSLHAGLQLGSESRQGFFRPRASIAPGLYIFNTETSIRPLDYEEDLIEINETQWRVGWKAAVGTDFFFSVKWGISLDFMYDHVLNMQRISKTDNLGNSVEISHPARFNGFMIGVVIPFDQMSDENEK
jgi:hypothetical protein